MQKLIISIAFSLVLALLFTQCTKEPVSTIPTVSATSPSDNATGTARNSSIMATFSLAMDSLTITDSTFTLKKGTVMIPGTISYSGLNATFAPTALLDANTLYTATITTGAKTIVGDALATNKVWTFTTAGSAAGEATVDLGTSISYVILAKTAINNTPTSAITGNIGLSPAATSYVTGWSLTNATGYATSPQIAGNIYAADMASPTPINLTTAVNNMMTAYDDAAGRLLPDFVELGAGNIGGRILSPGLYKWSSNVTIPSNMTISGSATDIWVFQISGNLSQSSAVIITLTGGALASNIFWQVAGQATIGTTAHFEGILLSKTAITLNTGASMNGRALAQTAVVLDNNIVVNP